MAKETNSEFKTLLSKTEYDRLVSEFKDKPSNVQTNYYFDTKRFSLKASDALLRLKEREKIELTLERKKGYNVQRINEVLTREQFESFLETNIIPVDNIKNDLSDILKDQQLINYMTLSTKRIYFNYKHGRLCIDKCTYVGTTDYELEYDALNYEVGKADFVEIIKDFGISYKKSQSKIKRAYDALKRQI